ncbi:hypothetical protein [Thermococcus thermotolerans]|uniref:hypothetical protein n=1 Tax=Thermococcus thermotolerans TaxID=2969672 RepID=UPI002157DCE5|nr:hypothetical protein [Thermococcus thermotolerans]
MKAKVVAILLLTIIATATLGTAASEFLSVERVYIQGSAKAFIFQPSTDGDVKLLKQGHVGGVLTFRSESRRWENSKIQNLHSTPTPIIVYFTKDGKIGIKSIVPGRKLVLDGMFPIEDVAQPSKQPVLNLPLTSRIKYRIRSLLGTSSCPWGYEELNARYCIIENWEYLKDSYYSESRTFVEWVPFMGLKVRTEGSKEIGRIGASWGIQLTTSTRAMWSFSVDGIPVIDFGSSYSGSTLKVSYAPEPDVRTENGYLDRYLNLPLKYVVVIYNIPVYDKWKKQYVSIPISGVYPVEVMMSGFHEAKEQNLNRDKLLTDYLISTHFPTSSTGSKVKVFKTTSYGTYDNIVFEFQSSSNYKFYSVPLGGSAASWLWSKLPGVGALSISFSYSKTSQSVVTYGVRVMNAPPNQLYYATILKRDIELANNNVELAMYFTTIDDGSDPTPPCFGNVCPTSINGGTADK